MSKRKLKTSTSFIEEAEILLCPVCEFEFLHPLSVKIATGIDFTVIDSKGTHVFRGLKAPEILKADRERGARIIIEYGCENGHHGEIILQFHKGNTFVEHEELPPTELPILWRS